MKKKKLPSFFADFPKERIKELMEEQNEPVDFGKLIEPALHFNMKVWSKQMKKRKKSKK